MSRVKEIVEAWLEEARTEGGLDVYSSKRAEGRYEWHRELELWDGKTVHYVKSRDISPSGVGITMRQSIDAGTKVGVRVDENDPWVPGVVQHATQTVGGYKTGMHFLLDEFDEAG